MYGETGDLMRTELAALLRQHRILHRLGDGAPTAPGAVPDREAAGIVIQQYRQTILSWCAEAVMAANTTIKVRQIGSPTRRRLDQRQNLIGLGLNRIGRVAEVPDTPSTRGMIARVQHLVEVLEPQGDKK